MVFRVGKGVLDLGEAHAPTAPISAIARVITEHRCAAQWRLKRLPTRGVRALTLSAVVLSSTYSGLRNTMMRVHADLYILIG